MKALIINPKSMNEYYAKIVASFFGWIAGLATIGHIKIPFLNWLINWSWLPTVHTNDVVVVIIGMFKAGLMGASSWVAVTGMQHGKRYLKRKWNQHKSKK